MTGPLVGQPLPRIDGAAKVTGGARYAADFNRPHQAYAVIVPSTIGRGRVVAVDDRAATGAAGVIAVLTHVNAPRLAYAPYRDPVIDPPIGERLPVLQDADVRFYGQPIGLVIAETLDQAEHAAAAVRVEYATATPVVDLSDARVQTIVPGGAGRPGSRIQADRARGDADGAMAAAAVRVDVTFDFARQNHNPMEPHATVAEWDGDRLTLWSKSQYVVNERAEIAAVFGIPPDHVHVINPFIGGAFGTSLRTWSHVTLAALAARCVGRPVKLVLTRRQMFVATGHRPRTVQRVALGATRDGRLTSLIHEGTAETSRYEQYIEALISASSFLYSCPNVRLRYRLAPLDISTPTFMRAPGEASGVCALECAMDEMAHALQMDPVELRRRNEAEIDEGEQRPFSSRSLLRCMERGADRFGWSRRDPRPRSMRDGRLLVGWGMAAATYPANQGPVEARVRVLAGGEATVEVAASDMGPGTYTSITQLAAELLGLPLTQVQLRLGDSELPPAPPHGGSMTMASVGTAVRAACIAAQSEAVQRATTDPASPLHGVAPDRVAWRGARLVRRDAPTTGYDYAEIIARTGGAPIEATARTARDRDVARTFSMHSFGAVFAEVSVDPDLGIVRVRRVVGAYGIGRIVNPRLAQSQCTGGMVGGIGMALQERTVLDARDGRPVNAHLADYLVPVNPDVPDLEVHFIDEEDPHVNPLGVKGVGELAYVGVASAIANAVFHATGTRLRELPIDIARLVGS